ncbi:MAG: undecaprenyl-phosphate glucose phosphotransferase [Acetobacteraceae bacterium]|nr:undecaprenyl-phosphate glucose phosphotransferase [Acetobacteraceae bacterium]
MTSMRAAGDQATNPVEVLSCAEAALPLDLSYPSNKKAPAFASDARAIFLAALRFGDQITITVTGVVAYTLRHHGSAALPAHDWGLVATTCIVAAVTLHASQSYDYSVILRGSLCLPRLAIGWGATLLLMISLAYFLKIGDEVSRAWMLLWSLTGFAGLVALRAGFWVWLARASKGDVFVFKVAILGEEGPAERLAEKIEDGLNGDARVVGIFRPQLLLESSKGSCNALDFAALGRLCARNCVDEIAVPIPCARGVDFHNVLYSLCTLPIDVKLYLDLPAPVGLGFKLPDLPTVLLSKRPLAGWRMMMKRAMDLVIGTALLTFFIPLMLLIAIAIKLDDKGPVIFCQERFGFSKKSIMVYKFRTMCVEAGADASVRQARRDDPRVTRIGRLLRRTSLDELPQLLNVLKGEMSLVGPRPHAVIHDQHYGQVLDGYLARHRVKPGITGWAQTNGYRGETDTIEKMKGRLEHDLFYINNWSPMLDLRILARTAIIGFYSRNAY